VFKRDGEKVRLHWASEMTSVVVVNLLTGEYVVGGASPQALYMCGTNSARKPNPPCGSNR
jgi:hypothetical protein